MSRRERSQRRMFDRAVRKLLRTGSDEEKSLVKDAVALGMIDDVYQLALDKFVADGKGRVIAYDSESQTPILDKLLEFFKWLWESGALLDLIKLIGGGGLSIEEDVRAFYMQLAA